MAQERDDAIERDDAAIQSEPLDLASSDDEEPREAAEIKEQIAETRNNMGETIDAIQDKLSLSNISDQVSEHVTNAVETAKGAVYDATIGKAAGIMKNIGNDIGNTSLVRTAKDNPLPFVFIGLGVGLLAYQGFSGGGKTRASGQRFKGGAADIRAKHATRNKLSDATERVVGVAGSAYESVTGAVDSVRSGASDVAGKAYERVGEFGSSARQTYDNYLEENPLALGAVAMALGAAVGMAIPSTQYEGELMGNARQELMDKAQTTATSLLDKTKQVVTEAGRAVGEQAAAVAEP